MFMHDTIKMEYVRQGYLPNFPYHLISDSEMMNAFISHSVVLDAQTCKSVQQGSKSLWDAPELYLPLYQLASFRFVNSHTAVELIGNKYLLINFLDVTGAKGTIELNPECYFAVNYDMKYSGLKDSYLTLVDNIAYHVSNYLTQRDKGLDAVLPTWIYSYMYGSVVGPLSEIEDRHDLLVSLYCDNIDDEFNEQAMVKCLEVSTAWLAKLPPSKRDHRSPSMFGEPHVLKSLRIAETGSYM